MFEIGISLRARGFASSISIFRSGARRDGPCDVQMSDSDASRYKIVTRCEISERDNSARDVGFIAR